MGVTDKSEILRDGVFARKQLWCRDPFIRWAHRGRFDTARRLLIPYAGQPILDYGCGDGTMLALIHDLFPNAVGCDIDGAMIALAAERLRTLQGLQFTSIARMEDETYAGKFAVVTCMEVIEHCVDAIREQVIADLRRLVRPDGVVVISVPIEIGPTLLIKQAIRALASWRKLSPDYIHRERYTPSELWRMTWAGARTAISRHAYGIEPQGGPPRPYHGHKGFNWRTLRERLEKEFLIERQLFSPIHVPGGLLSSQAWFVCRKR